jgi:hypothetical protein
MSSNMPWLHTMLFIWKGSTNRTLWFGPSCIFFWLCSMPDCSILHWIFQSRWKMGGLMRQYTERCGIKITCTWLVQFEYFRKKFEVKVVQDLFGLRCTGLEWRGSGALQLEISSRVCKMLNKPRVVGTKILDIMSGGSKHSWASRIQWRGGGNAKFWIKIEISTE